MNFGLIGKMVRETLERRPCLFTKLEFETEAGWSQDEILAGRVSQIEKVKTKN